MSKTPRTNALLLEINEGRVYVHDGPIVDLCRQLETELSNLQSHESTARPVATVEVGHHDHGPFNFKETPYGADTLSDGKHDLYAAPQKAVALTERQSILMEASEICQQLAVNGIEVNDIQQPAEAGDCVAALKDAARKEKP